MKTAACHQEMHSVMARQLHIAAAHRRPLPEQQTNGSGVCHVLAGRTDG